MSAPGAGSTFTLYLPMTCTPPATRTPSGDRSRECLPGAGHPRPRRGGASPRSPRHRHRGWRATTGEPSSRATGVCFSSSRTTRRIALRRPGRSARAGLQGAITSFGAAALGLSQEFQPVAITSTSRCRTSAATGCSSASRTTWRPATSRCTSSPPTTTSSAVYGLGARRVITKPLPAGEALEETVAAIKRHTDASHARSPDRRARAPRAGSSSSRSSAVLRREASRRVGSERRRASRPSSGESRSAWC